MSLTWRATTHSIASTLAILLLTSTMAPVRAQTDSPTKVDPEINAQFQRKGAAKNFAERFESHDREVFNKREEILKALELKPGMAVADVGAGSGLFTRLFAEKVGPTGRVIAVDVSQEFLKHIADDASKRKWKHVKTVLGTQTSTELEADSVDLIFLSDVYHHFEDHEAMLGSMRQALRPGGTLILVEFDRRVGESSDFILKHVRAGQDQFIKEFQEAGFTLDEKGARPAGLKENFFVRFHKPIEKDPDAEAVETRP